MLENILAERKKKLNNLKKAGVNPYPSKVRRTISIAEAVNDFDKLSKTSRSLSVVGRIMALRDQGSLIFIDLRDENGKVQVVIKKNKLKKFSLLKENLDTGDFLSITGILFKTQKGEKSIEANSVEIITKAMRPLPAQWYGLKDVEERFRRRYLDIILNPAIKDKIIERSQIIQNIRENLFKEGFLEVETPILQPLAGGARARPFITHHNALGADFYLRIAPELYLKRLLVSGFEKIFEIGRDFRNEGIDREHNPEFTMLELYWAYQDWEGLMKFSEKVLKDFFPGKWSKITFAEAVRKYSKKDIKKLKTEEIDDTFKKEVRPKIIKPTLVTHYPKSISPLAKACFNEPELTERFQLVVDGSEVINGFSELNDPIDQRERMEEQERQYRAGDKEASRLDQDFLEALEFGMPPAAGLGIGIDRLVALATKSHSLKEVIIFPTLKPKL